MPADHPEAREAVVLDFQPRPRPARREPDMPAHLRRPMSADERRRAGRRGIANARHALARARIRRVPDDG